jgi:hypothetical protein
MVFADTDVFTGHDGGTALANDNFAYLNLRTITTLNAKVFRI